MRRKPLTLWKTLQRTPPVVCFAMAVKRDRKRGIAHKTVKELMERSGIRRRTLQALAYRREWPMILKTVSDFAEACGVNLLARDPRQPFRRLTQGVSVSKLLMPEQRKGMMRLAKGEDTANGRLTLKLTINGETRYFMEWAKRIGIGRTGLKSRLRNGLTGDELLKPSQKHHPRLAKEIKK